MTRAHKMFNCGPALLVLAACSAEDVPLSSASEGPKATLWTSLDDGESESESESADSGLLPKLDIFVDTSTEWLLHFPPENGSNTQWQMVRIDIETGYVKHQCFPKDTAGEAWPTSSTFTRDDRLMVSNGYALWEITLPECVGEKIADYPEAHSIINGITPDEGDGLYGLSAASGSLVAIDPDTGAVTPLGSLDIPLTGSHGATWIESEQQLYMVDGGTDTLYRVDPETVATTVVTAIDHDFEWVGFEYHPHNETLYGCSYDAQIISIALDGSTEVFAELELPCNNLAAPWGDPDLPSPG